MEWKQIHCMCGEEFRSGRRWGVQRHDINTGQKRSLSSMNYGYEHNNKYNRPSGVILNGHEIASHMAIRWH